MCFRIFRCFRKDVINVFFSKIIYSFLQDFEEDQIVNYYTVLQLRRLLLPLEFLHKPVLLLKQLSPRFLPRYQLPLLLLLQRFLPPRIILAYQSSNGSGTGPSGSKLGSIVTSKINDINGFIFLLK